MVPDIGSHHTSHPEISRREIASQTAYVKRRNCSGEKFLVGGTLRHEPGDQSRQGVAGSGRSQSGIAGRIDEHAAVGAAMIEREPFNSRIT